MEINSSEGKVVIIVSSDKKRVVSSRVAKRHKSISFLSSLLCNSSTKEDNSKGKKEYA